MLKANESFYHHYQWFPDGILPKLIDVKPRTNMITIEFDEEWVIDDAEKDCLEDKEYFRTRKGNQWHVRALFLPQSFDMCSLDPQRSWRQEADVHNLCQGQSREQNFPPLRSCCHWPLGQAKICSQRPILDLVSTSRGGS